jgi:hypothetical protein
MKCAMPNQGLLRSLILCLALPACVVADPTTRPAASTSPASTTPSSTAPAVDATETLLDGLFQVGVNMKTLRADVSLAEQDEETGKDDERRGQFVILRTPEGDMHARVNFTMLIRDQRRIERHRIEYLLAGEWLVDRTYPRNADDPQDKGREVRRQVRKPGEKTDLFKLGEGPFPLPLGQSPAAVRAQFDVSPLPADPERAGLSGLMLVPLESNRLGERFKWISLWIDPADMMPRVIQTEDQGIPTLRTTTLSNVAVNQGVTEADLKLDPIDQSWQVIVEEMK